MVTEGFNTNAQPTPTPKQVCDFVSAAGAGDLSEVRWYVERFGQAFINAPINHLDHCKGANALTEASRNGRMECLQYLLENGADVDHQDENGNTACIQTVKRGHIQCLRLLIAFKADIHKQNKDGLTAAMAAAKNSFSTPCLDMLIKHKADLYKADNFGDTALHWAHNVHNAEGLRLIKSTVGISVNEERAAPEEAITAFIKAAEEGDVDTLEQYIKHYGHAIINTPLTDTMQGKSRSPLIVAVLNKQIDSVHVLIAAGANIEARDTWEGTAIMRAALMKNNVRCLTALIKAKANVNKKDNDGMTALMGAASQGNNDYLPLLLKAGADSEARNNSHQNSSDLAHINTNSEAIHILDALPKALHEKAVRHDIESLYTGTQETLVVPHKRLKLQRPVQQLKMV